MSWAITISEVKDGFSTSASDADLAAYMALVDQADACLTLKGVHSAVGRQLKILGVRHLATSSSDRGAVVEEQAVSGARRRYNERAGGETGYLQTLRSIDQYGCVLGLVNRNARIQFRSVGRLSSTLED